MSFLKLRRPVWAAAVLALAVLGIGSLAVAAVRRGGARSSSRRPRSTTRKRAGPPQTAVLAGGCFWGVQGVYRACSRRAEGDRRLRRRRQSDRPIRDRELGDHGPCRIGQDNLRSGGDFLRANIADSVFGRARSHSAQPAGPRCRHSIPFRRFSTATTLRSGSPRHISASWSSSHAYARPIVTRVDPLKGFYPAEDYHQDYLIHNPNAPYIAFFDIPKIENFKQTFPELYSGRPVLAHN